MARIVFFYENNLPHFVVDYGDNNLTVLRGCEYFKELLEHTSAFYVPTIFDADSALSYDGVDLAIRVYLDCIAAGICDFSLFLLSAEDKASFYSHCDRADLLKCPNVYFLKNTKNSIEASIGSLKIQPLEREAAVFSLKSLRIKAPSAYKTHHSITNEWSIYRWSRYMGIDNVSISSEIEDSIYFKHLSIIRGLQALNNSVMLPCFCAGSKDQKARVLLIDDEAEKGWHDFFKGALSKSTLMFDSLGESFFRSKTSREIEEIAIATVRAFNPDVIILDLRLEDADFDLERKTEGYTGIRILKRIKNEVNRGIQVIGFTASNKVWNYLEWNDSGHGIEDIVVKESPELSENPSYTTDAIKHLFSSIKTCLERAKYLKVIDSSLKQIGSLIGKTSHSFFLREKHSLDISFELIKQYDVDLKYLTYAYIQLFQILEKYLNSISGWNGESFEIKYKGNKYVLLKSLCRSEGKAHCESAIKFVKRKGFSLGKGTVDVRGFVESNFIMCAALIFLFGHESIPDEWKEVRDVRNKKAVHPEKFGDVTKGEVLSLINYLQFFFNPSNLKLRKESEALAPSKY